MNKFKEKERFVQCMKDSYPPGTRLVLLSMDDPYAPIPRGMRGTVDYIDDAAQIHMRWDNGRTLAIIPEEDDFRKLTEEELDELGYDVAWQVLNSKDFGVPQSRKREYIIGYLRSRCTREILSFTEANGAPVIQVIPGTQGERVYSDCGVGITLTSGAGGFGGKCGLYEVGIPVKVKTKTGYQIAHPGDSIDLAYPSVNSRRGRVGNNIAHTVTPRNTQ